MPPADPSSSPSPEAADGDWSLQEHAPSPEHRCRFESGARPPPAQVGRYQILGSIGHGGMGIVYLAQHPVTQQQVALKAIIPHSVTRSAVEQFLEEIRLLARVRHPGIAQVYDADTYTVDEERRPYFTMELVEGAKPVTHYVQDALCGYPRRLDLALQAAAAVAHAHELGICHGDLKPSNVLVALDGRVKVVDFGAAIEVARGFEGQRAWTPGPYAAPELYVPAQPVSLAADVYALAVLVFQMVSGKLPFEPAGSCPPPADDSGSRPLSGPERPARVPIPLRRLTPQAGRRVEAVLRKALEHNPGARYASVVEFHCDLERASRDRTLSLERASAWTRARDNYLDHRKSVWAISAVLVSLLAGLTATTWKSREAERQRLRAEGESVRAKELAGQEHAARQRAEGAEASTAAALELLQTLLFSVDTYRVRDQSLDLNYVFGQADVQLPAAARQDPRAGAIGYGALGRVATDWGRYELAERWLTRAAQLWSAVAAEAPDSEAGRKAKQERANVLNHLVWAKLGDQGERHGLRERAAGAVSVARESFALYLDVEGPGHQDTLCAQADWLRMRQLAGDDVATVLTGFMEWLATAAGQRQEEFLATFVRALRETARCTAAGDAAGARASVRALLEPVVPPSRPRLRARVPLSLARASQWVDSSRPLLTLALMPFGVPSRDLPPLSRTLMEVAREWGRQELPPGHPDRETVEKLAAGLLKP